MDFRLRQFQPSPALAPFVQAIWMVEGFGYVNRAAVLPNGVVELMVNFGPTQKVHAYGDVGVDEDFERSWLAGIQDRPLVIGSPDGTNHMGVRFRPGGAHAFFDISMEGVTNCVVDLDLLIGSEAELLREWLGQAPTPEARVREVEVWLAERRQGVHSYYATVRRAIDLLRESSFALGVGELCEQLGLSNRHLIAQFRRVVGLPPKTIGRIERFQAVVRSIRGEPKPRWSQLAYRFGFSDQAHLSREFRHFAGVSPTQFVAQRLPESDHVAVE